MKERPILFSAPMVRAILDGTKTQTRRVVKLPNHPRSELEAFDLVHGVATFTDANPFPVHVRCPYGTEGDRLWVRETFHSCPHCKPRVCYRAGGWIEPPTGAPDDGGDRDDKDTRPLAPKCAAHGWMPSIHIRRRASRIDLEVTEVRVERLQAITSTDAIAEGIQRDTRDARIEMLPEARLMGFEQLWRDINGADSWDANPWVWVVSFRRVRP